MTKPLLLFVSIFGMQAFIGCCGLVGCCGDGDFEDYRIEDMSFVASRIGDSYPYAAIDDKIRFDSLIFQIESILIPETDFIASCVSGGLMACSPDEPIILDSVTSIEIFSDREFEGIESGNDIAEYFSYSNNFVSEPHDRSLNWASNLSKIGDFVTYSYEQRIYLWSFGTPAVGDYVFTFKIGLSDGRDFEFQTDTIAVY